MPANHNEVKVILRLTDEQYGRIIHHLLVKPVKIPATHVWCGTLLGQQPFEKVLGYAWMELMFGGDHKNPTHYVILEGMRETLHDIGAYRILREVLGDYQQGNVVRYTSTDERLYWYETYSDYLQSRAEISELRWNLSNQTEHAQLAEARLRTLAGRV